MNTRMVFLLMLVAVLLAGVSLAQDDACPTIVQSALQATDSACEATGRNKACYGHPSLAVIPREGITEFTFTQAGDIVAVDHIESLNLQPLTVVDGFWGVALLRLQANLPDTLPGQNVTFLLFGDTHLTNDVPNMPTLGLTANTGVNVRLRPSGDGTLIGSLTAGTAVVANGRFTNSAGEDWIRIRFTEHRERTGWVIAWAFSGEGIDALASVQPSDPVQSTMQAFRLQTGIGDAVCAEAPESGLLIQTPTGSGVVTLQANGVELDFTSSAFLQATPGEYMYIYVIEGTVSATAFGVTQFIPAGTVGRVRLGEDGLASAAPEYPYPYDFDKVRALPVNISLPADAEAITIATPLPDEAVSAAVDEATAAGGSVARDGYYECVVVERQEDGCDISHDTAPPVGGTGGPGYLVFSADGSSLTDVNVNLQFTSVGPGVYVAQSGADALGNSYTWTITVLSPTTISERVESSVYCPHVAIWACTWSRDTP